MQEKHIKLYKLTKITKLLKEMSIDVKLKKATLDEIAGVIDGEKVKIKEAKVGLAKN